MAPQGWQQDSSWLIWEQDQPLVLKISSRANNHSINIWFGLGFYVIFHFACMDLVSGCGFCPTCYIRVGISGVVCVISSH